MYRNNFHDTPRHKLIEGDMGELEGMDLLHDASIARGSSLCTDLSRWYSYGVERQTIRCFFGNM
jgi:hypothetical protein